MNMYLPIIMDDCDKLYLDAYPQQISAADNVIPMY